MFQKANKQKIIYFEAQLLMHQVLVKQMIFNVRKLFILPSLKI